MRSDPKRGEQIRSYEAFESSMREAARSYWGEGFGRDSLSGKETNRFFLSRGGKQFANLSGLSGLDHTGDGRSMALLDFNHDGRQDLVVASANAPKLTLFKNEIGKAGKNTHAVTLRLVGGNRSATASKDWSNRDAIGVRILVESDGIKTMRHLQAGEGFSAQNSNQLLLFTGKKIDQLTIYWPSGKRQIAKGIHPAPRFVIYENPVEAQALGGSNGFVRSELE